MTSALLAAAGTMPLPAVEKTGMPDLSQIEQTCLPTATANLLIWFGRHGYPKLLPAGATDNERELAVVHRVMIDTGARFDLGTRMDAVTDGIKRFIGDAGYAPDVEYRGLGGSAFDDRWLRQNDDPGTGFILVLAYCHWDEQYQIATPALRSGHAVTLVNFSPGMMLVHDPAHPDDETGRKILTPLEIKGGTWADAGNVEPAAGLLFLSGSLLQAPPNSQVILAGAVRISLHPVQNVSPRHAGGPAVFAATGGAGHSTQGTGTWWSWLCSPLF